MNVFYRPETDKEGGEERELGVCLRVACRLLGGTLL